MRLTTSRKKQEYFLKYQITDATKLHDIKRYDPIFLQHFDGYNSGNDVNTTRKCYDFTFTSKVNMAHLAKAVNTNIRCIPLQTDFDDVNLCNLHYPYIGDIQQKHPQLTL